MHKRKFMIYIHIVRNKTGILSTLLILLLITGCVSERVNSQGYIPDYQEKLVQKGPQARMGPEGIDSITPTPDPAFPELDETSGDNGRRSVNLTLDDAVMRTLANSPEIKIVSFDPSIARENITAAVSEFDVTAFGQLQYDDNDNPSNDLSLSGQSTSSLVEAGIKQKGITGAEWSLAYTLDNVDDNSPTRIVPETHEPAMVFELRQPLLRNAWRDVNLAGINISKLGHRSALETFRQKAESLSADVSFLYWNLFQARRNVEIQEDLLEKTNITLKKVSNRKKIDATVGDIKQAEASVKSREAALLESRKRLYDVQDRLVRLLADNQVNLTGDIDIIPVTYPVIWTSPFDQTALIRRALRNNAVVSNAKLEAEITEINLKVAKKQKLPKLDLVASAQLQGLSDSQGTAHEMITDADYASYSVGLKLEYPLGNRSKKAGHRQKKLKHLKALSHLQNISDQVANLVREKIRSAETAQSEIKVQQGAVNAARIHLQTLEDIEIVRKKLTPEFLLAKIQAQESLADAQKAKVQAIVNFNTALSGLSQATGTILDQRLIK